MSGGGGSYGQPWRPRSVAPTFEQTRRHERAIAVAEVVQRAVSRISQTDTPALERHKQTILDALNDQFEGAYNLHGGGSYTRGTYVRGVSDVDVLLNLGEYARSDIANKNDPAALLEEMRARIQQRLPSTSVTAGKMAVTVTFSDGHEIQVLPAFRAGDGFRIPDPQAGGWTVTRPREFRRLLDERTREIGGGLRRAIKLAKELCDRRGIDIRSYHLETMAVQAFKGYRGPTTTPDMLRHLFGRAKSLALNPMPDVTGQEEYVDRYLGAPGQRARLARTLAAVERAIVSAGDDPAAWRDLLG